MQCLLVTGITGSFGRAFLQHIERQSTWDIIGIARNEGRLERLKQTETRAILFPRDITDWTQLQSIECDAIVHAAALKRVGSSQENPEEYARVNIGGTINITRLARRNGAKLLFISSDKACAAHNHYGATKKVGEGIVLRAGGTVVRGGNVWGSDGSVSQHFMRSVLDGQSVVLHDAEATRFHLPMGPWVNFVMTVLMQMQRGELYVPKLSAYRMGDLADAFHRVHGLKIVLGNRQLSDKQHEVLISDAEAPWIHGLEWAYTSRKPIEGEWSVPVPAEGIRSETARRMQIDELKELVQQL